MAIYKIVPKRIVNQSDRCLLDETAVCNDCGECDRCDLISNKICDNCGKCLDEADYNGIMIDEIIDD